MPVALALVHHPVLDRRGEVVTTAVTNMDVHDIARSCRVYDLARYYVVTPVEAQWRVVERILEHWTVGAGARRLPTRGEALARVRLMPSLTQALRDFEEVSGAKPELYATGARPGPDVPRAPYERVAERAERREASLLVFGTGHGLAPDALARCTATLPPIRSGGYNHLSVRAAVAITLDRIFGDERARSSDPRPQTA